MIMIFIKFRLQKILSNNFENISKILNLLFKIFLNPSKSISFFNYKPNGKLISLVPLTKNYTKGNSTKLKISFFIP